MSTRPRPEVFKPALVQDGRVAATARKHAAQVRCKKRHLLAAVVNTPHGAWVYWRGGLLGSGWLCAWHDELPDAHGLDAWCPGCVDNWRIDVSDPRNPAGVAIG